MSDHKDRRAALDAMTLAQRFEAAGIPVPDQATARTMMEASRRGLPLNTPAEHMASPSSIFARWARPFRRLRATSAQQWSIFTVEQYATVPSLTYGAPMPLPVQSTLLAAQKAVPGVVARVYAVPKDDPWLELSYKGESLIMRGWLRTFDGVTIIL